MTTKDLIDIEVTDWLGLSLTDPYVADEWRPKLLRVNQRVVSEVWDASDWAWKHGVLENETLLANTNQYILPLNFGTFGVGGKLFIPGQGIITYKSPRYFQEQGWFVNPGSAQYPEYYTIHGVDAATKRLLARFSDKPPANVSLSLMYEKKRPTLLDNNGATNGLDELPEDFHLDVVYPGAVDLIAVPMGDGRAITELSPRFKTALARKISRQQQGLDALEQYGEHGVPEEGMW